MKPGPTSGIVAILAASASFSASKAHSVQAAELVRDAVAVAVIVTPEKPLPVVQAAAEELQYHIRRASGAELPIVTESQRPESRPCVLLGTTKAAQAAGLRVPADTPNCFVIKLVGNSLLILGDDSEGQPFWIQHGNRVRVGTLFGVYEFLERRLGVRWLWPGELGTLVPRTATLAVDHWQEEVGKPPFLHARWRDGGDYMAGPQGWAAQENRSRFLNEQGKWLRRHRFAMGLNMDMAHSSTDWWDRFAKEHPQYFNLLPDGTRRSDPLYHGGAKELVAMCVSEPGVWRQKVADWTARRTPEAPYIDASENDTAGKCLCEKCLAWDEPDPGSAVPFGRRAAEARDRFNRADREWYAALGSLSDRYARFYLAVQKEAEAVDPHAVVMGYSYANYVKPPCRTRLNQRIIIGIVPALMFPWTPEKQRQFREQWDGWAAAAARLFLRPNYMLDGHNLPIFFARKLGEDFTYAAANGLVGTDFDSLTGQFATQGPNLYMLARLHDDPSLTAEAVLAEFYSAFGKAAPDVEKYFAHWKRVSNAVTDDVSRDADLHWSYFYRNADRIFTSVVMAQGRAILERAKASAAGDPEAEARVAYLDSGLRNAELTLAVQRAFRADREASNFESCAEALAELDGFRARVEGDLVANMAYLAWAENRFWDRPLIKRMATPGIRLPGPWQFRFDPNDEGLAAHWFAEPFDASGWQEAGAGSAWEEQSAGKTWKNEHRADYNGVAWYRTSFDVPPGDPAREVRLLFGAIGGAGTVWVNGQKLLERDGPTQASKETRREPFEADVSNVVRRDRPNTLAVRVDDRGGAGGILRPVWLAVAEAPASEEKNLLGNGGFEHGETGWGRSIMSGKFAFAIDTAESHHGQTSARLTCIETVPQAPQEAARRDAWGRWYRTDARVEEGRTYQFRVWVKTSNEFAGRVTVFLTGDKTLSTRTGEMLNTQGLWRELVVEGFVPKSAEAGVYLNVYDSTGTVWFDDVELVPRP
ncbi:MAG: DUF4838 domain-containing protein [Pirellulales bacterium]|nr:DUF4838 domain-containing protein [Pirellulales bacterium]